MMHSFVFMLLLNSSSPPTSEILRCSRNVKQSGINYYFVASCTQSKMKMIAKRYSNNLQSCQRFAMRHKAFAFNYVHREYLHREMRNYTGETCLLFDCPEFDVQLSFERNTVFDYYSSYAMPMPRTNVSCIPKIGIFQLHKERMNFTNALDICNDEGGNLAEVLDEVRTSQLASLISSLREKEAFVGLHELQYSGKFLTSYGWPLDCASYRAWAPSEPKKHSGARCVVVTSEGFWKAILCSRNRPFLCEMQPYGPFKPCRRFRNWRRRRNCIEKFSRSFPTEDRYPKCGDPAFSNHFKEEQYPTNPGENNFRRRNNN